MAEPIEVFVDGACLGNPGPGGYAAIIKRQEEEEVLSGGVPLTTNNKMELTAAIEALKRTPPESEVVIYTDSKYLLEGAIKWLPKWKRNSFKGSKGKTVKNLELWLELERLLRERKVRWIWVRAHSGHTENERCDELAKKEAKKYLK